MTSTLFDLSGRVVVVTGGLGQLGQQYAHTLLDHGAKVVLLDLAADDDRLSAPLVAARDSGRLLLMAADVTDRSSLEAALANIGNQWATPHGLINNAALDSPPDASVAENGPFEDYPEASWDQVMAVNVKGTFLPCQVFGGAMASGNGGSIVNVSSIYGMVSPDQSLYAYRRAEGEDFYKPVAYSASKSALYNLTRYLATYWGEAGVRVNTVTLGGVFNNQDEKFLANYVSRVPLGRMAREDEYNGAIIFLMSDAAVYMTGSNLVIDGGWTAW